MLVLYERSDGTFTVVSPHHRLPVLADEEERLLDIVSKARGAFEARSAELEAQGVYQAYAEVHRGYAELAAASDAEALKRAVFLQWFAVLEPSALIGVRDLHRRAVESVVELLEAQCATATLDDELAWMLPYYFQIAAWAFPPAGECPHLVAFCEEHEPTGLVQPPAETSLHGRGQMGRYWAEMRQAGR